MLPYADPLLKSIIRAWNILDATGFLSDTAKTINIRDHVNTEIYAQALKEATEEYGTEDPEFYARMQKFFDENNNL